MNKQQAYFTEVRLKRKFFLANFLLHTLDKRAWEGDKNVITALQQIYLMESL
jgi:hypothetical protein